MDPIQVKALPADLQASLSQLSRDFKAALSYVSFYSSDSPFVIQAVEKCQRDLQKILQTCGYLALYLDKGKLSLNGVELSELGDLAQIFQDKSLKGVEFIPGLTAAELASWMKKAALPVADPQAGEESFGHVHPMNPQAVVEIVESPAEPIAPVPTAESFVTESVLSNPLETEAAPGESVPAGSSLPLQKLARDGQFSFPTTFTQTLGDSESKSKEALLSFVAEAWQYSQLQKRNLGAAPEMAEMAHSFDKLFERLLDRAEKTSPDFADIHQWFSSPQGTLLESRTTASMLPLLEAAVSNGWTAVLFDPATEGLVGECLATWGASGRHELVEKTVGCLADSLESADPLERQLGLTHLMDARPWVRNTELLKKVLDRLNRLLGAEVTPGLYQSALLLAWDLMEPALNLGCEQSALTLLSILHFHADEEADPFPGRAKIARHWLFERSSPEMIRRFTGCAFAAGQLRRFPLLGEMASPLLLEDFFQAEAKDKGAYLRLFAEMGESLRSALAERLAEAKDEAQVKGFMPILRVCGMDPALSLQLSAWISKGSRDLKLELISVIEESGNPGGGPALRLALFDDSQEIASAAARVIGKIRFLQGIPVLLKAAKIREERFPENEAFLIAVCQSLGDLGSTQGAPFLQDIARKKPLLRGKNFPLTVRLAAIQALTKINQPEVWSFLGTLMEEKNPALQEALDKIIHEKIQSL